MRNSNGSFFEHAIRIKVEGFDHEKLLTECIKKGIPLRDVHTASDLEISLTLTEWDYPKFLKLARNRYQVTVLRESGYKPAIKKTFQKKSTIAGLMIFTLLLYYQSTFVSEIRISGYEKYTEAEIRNSLREAGLFEGCSKGIDLRKTKLRIYQDLDNIAWIGVKYIGNLAEVTIVEGTVTPKPVDKSKPCHIVADKEGYIERTIAREGVVAAQPGVYVKPGDVLISGIVPVKSTAYGTPAVDITERYVHSEGEVYARIPYRLFYYQEKYKYLKETTGRRIYGFRLQFGDLKINTARMLYTYENSVYTEKNLAAAMRPFPLSVGFVRIDEVEVTRLERSREEIQKEANRLVRQEIKEILPENSQILNKSLKFSPGENIIGIAVMLESLEKIGKEKEIFIGNPIDRRTEDQNRP